MLRYWGEGTNDVMKAQVGCFALDQEKGWISAALLNQSWGKR